MPNGTIINKTTGVRIEGHKTETQKGEFTFRIPGTKYPNILQEADWDFEPEVLPLPGDNHVLLRQGRYPLVNVGGKWYQIQWGAEVPTLRFAPEKEVRTQAEYGKFFNSKGEQITP